MKIIIVGDGKVGSTLAEQLVREGHNVTIIDNNAHRATQSDRFLDIMSVQGNGATFATQLEAGVDQADLLVAATSSDELNLLCCLVAKRSGARHTIARVRNPEYSSELSLFKDDLGLSLAVNPELFCANEMARVLRFPSAIKIDTFARGRVEILKLAVPAGSPLDGLLLKNISRVQDSVLVCIVERGDGEVLIPDGNTQLLAGDRISIVASPAAAAEFFRKVSISASPIRQVMLVGGGRIAFYLSKLLLESRVAVKIIEADRERCQQLSELLPKATIIHGDGTDQQLLLEEGLLTIDGFASLTGMDEENILMSLYAKKVSRAKVITKINRTSFEKVLGSLEVGSVFHPRFIAADAIMRYIRAMQNSLGSNVETLYQLVEGKVEALEFRVSPNSAVIGKPLMELKLRPGLLIGCITRNGRPIIPHGSDCIQADDTVVVITTITGLNDLNDILSKRK